MQSALWQANWSDPQSISVAAWNALGGSESAVLQHEFLALLQASGVTTADSGWLPHFLTLSDEAGELQAGLPAYIKGHSHGEFVYDWHWAHAAEQAGLNYYPKLFIGPPLSPLSGSRILGNSELAPACLQQVDALCEAQQLSSVHIGCTNSEHAELFITAGYLPRKHWQYHWHRQGAESFDDYLYRLKHKRRKNIKAERNAIAAQKIECRHIPGVVASAEDWQTMYRFYATTFAEKGNWATLNEAFFVALGNSNLETHLLFAYQDDNPSPVAGALFLSDTDRLYGRYWGATVNVPHLHFEVCYYQGIELAIQLNKGTFEPGALGEHKLTRGFDPTEVITLHKFFDPRLHKAVAAALEQESERHADYGDVLRQHVGYRQGEERSGHNKIEISRDYKSEQNKP